jgi:hypothetical protein
VFDRLRARVDDWLARARRLERRELRAVRRWLEDTGNLLHLSVLLFVPLLVGLVTLASNRLGVVVFLLFPPLASGTYTLFADPEGRYADPRRFVGGMTLGALSGWVALEATRWLWTVPAPGVFRVPAGAAALGVGLTAALTWALDLEVPSAFSTALLVLLLAGGRTASLWGVVVSEGLLYVVGVVTSSAVVAGVFVVWRAEFYEERARYLYETTRGDDRVLVPMRGPDADAAVAFAGALAAAHDAGKVVLLDVVDDADVADEHRAALDRLADTADSEAGAALEEAAVADPVRRLERTAADVRERLGVVCQVLVAVGDPADPAVARRAAADANCDLVVAPAVEADGRSPYVEGLFGGDVDVVGFRSAGATGDWEDVMVPVRRGGDQAHAMLEFALRASGPDGTVSVCRCIDSERSRRRAEDELAQIVEPFDGRFETRVARQPVEEFVTDNAGRYDLVLLGASTDRSAASRFVSPPTFERLRGVDADVGVVHAAR